MIRDLLVEQSTGLKIADDNKRVSVCVYTGMKVFIYILTKVIVEGCLCNFIKRASDYFFYRRITIYSKRRRYNNIISEERENINLI